MLNMFHRISHSIRLVSSSFVWHSSFLLKMTVLNQQQSKKPSTKYSKQKQIRQFILRGAVIKELREVSTYFVLQFDNCRHSLASTSYFKMLLGARYIDFYLLSHSPGCDFCVFHLSDWLISFNKTRASESLFCICVCRLAHNCKVIHSLA